MRKKMVGTRLNWDMLRRLEGWAKTQGLTTSAAVERLVLAGLNAEDIHTALKMAGQENRYHSINQIVGALLYFAEVCRSKPQQLEIWANFAQKFLTRPT